MEVGTVLAIIQTSHSVLGYITRIVEGFHGDDTSQDKLIRLRKKVLLVTQTLERSKVVRGPHEHIDDEILKTVEACAKFLKDYDAAASQRGGVKPNYQRARLVLDHRKIDRLNERLRDHVGELQLLHLIPHDLGASEGEQTLVTPASPALVPSKPGQQPSWSPSRTSTGDTYVEHAAAGGGQLSTSPSATGTGRPRQSGSPYFAPIPEDSELLNPGATGPALGEQPWQGNGHAWLGSGAFGSTSYDESAYAGFTQSPSIGPADESIPRAQIASYSPSRPSPAFLTEAPGAEVTIFLAKESYKLPVDSLGIMEDVDARVASFGTTDFSIWHYVPRGNLGIPYTRPEQKEVDFLPRDQWHKVKVQKPGREATQSFERPKYKFSTSSARRQFEKAIRGCESLQTFSALEITTGSVSRTLIARDVDVKIWVPIGGGNPTFTFAKNVSSSSSKNKKNSGPKHAEYYISWFSSAMERSDSSKRITLKLKIRKSGDSGSSDTGQKLSAGTSRRTASLEMSPSSASRKSSVMSIGSIGGYEGETVPDAVAQMGSLRIDFTRSVGESFAKAWVALRTPLSSNASLSYASDSSTYPSSYTSSRPPSESWALSSPNVGDSSPRFEMLPPPSAPETSSTLFNPSEWTSSTMEEHNHGGDGYAPQSHAEEHTSSTFKISYSNS